VKILFGVRRLDAAFFLFFARRDASVRGAVGKSVGPAFFLFFARRDAQRKERKRRRAAALQKCDAGTFVSGFCYPVCRLR
jgi:hypothetical protein